MDGESHTGKVPCRVRLIGVFAVTAASVIAVVAMLWSPWHAKGPETVTQSSQTRPPVAEPQIDKPAALKTSHRAPAALPPNAPTPRPSVVGPPERSLPAPSPNVLPTGYDAAPTRALPDSRRADPNLLILSTSDPTQGESLELVAGQHVRGGPGGRPLVEVSSLGLVVRPENVRFENVDFVWKSDSQHSAAGPGPAIIVLEASRAEFHGCSFQPADQESGPVVAIRWTAYF